MRRVLPFGSYVRRMREKAGLTQRYLAKRLRLTHVYLSEVERGTRGALPMKHWPMLMNCIPGLTEKKLADTAMLSRPYRFKIPDTEETVQLYEDTIVAFIRRIEANTLGAAELQRLLAILQEPPPERRPT